jgi:hypothetical protein
MKRQGTGLGSGSGLLAATSLFLAAGCLPAEDGGDQPGASMTTQALKQGRGGRQEKCRRGRADVPAPLAVPADACLQVRARGWGEQIYTCAAGAWVLKAPEANLLDDRGRYLGNHFLGPTWQWRDGSKIRGVRLAQVAAPDPGHDIPWLLMSAVNADGDGELAGITYIQRLDTAGGVAPAGVCTAGAEIRVSYAADYLFHGPRRCDDD